jgi:phage-related minor tail protein
MPADDNMAEKALRMAEQAIARVDTHEKICAQRYDGIMSVILDVKKMASRHEVAAWSVVIALLAWLAVQVYGNLKPPAPTTYQPIYLSPQQWPAGAPQPGQPPTAPQPSTGR